MTTTRRTLVSLVDRDRLAESVRTARASWRTYAPYLDWFRNRLAGARAVPSAGVPADVLTMNTRFTVRDLKSGEAAGYTLVYPNDEAPDEGKLSVLSPMGTALLGARVRDVVRWVGADGPRAVEVEQILYQPEDAGDYDL
jgi:regulator of nucleoside diphosphate kinase